ncbi:MAG TPA: lytic murein transglycosylase [Micromonosporaceae bacterium]
MKRLAFSFRSLASALRRPGGRLGLHGLALLAILLGAGYTGMYVVPSGSQVPTATQPSQVPSGGSGGAPGGQIPAGQLPPAGQPSGSPSLPPEGQPTRPQDTLAAWAGDLERIGVPKVALQAYGYAELALAQSEPNCRLSWTTLAGIGRIESNHGRSHGATLLADGRSNPPVVGLPLDGGPGRKEIKDTDGGELDGDPTYDRAVGPMQFIPTTWQRWATDGDGDGRSDPFDIDDAALAAGRYLCAGGRNLSTGDGWWNAILSYNQVDSYVRDVYAAADEYGRLSRGAA